MINLLPPAVKEQGKYARINKELTKYLVLTVVVAILAAAEFGGMEYYIARQRSHLNQEVGKSQSKIAAYKDLQAKASDANARIQAFKSLTAGQTRFSDLLTDLADHTPKGVFINSITLTGNTSQAVKISATANSYDAAASLRDALVTSPRISEANIEDVSNPSAGVYSVDVTVAFKPGAFQ